MKLVMRMAKTFRRSALNHKRQSNNSALPTSQQWMD
jgi:hypothetical protein